MLTVLTFPIGVLLRAVQFVLFVLAVLLKVSVAIFLVAGIFVLAVTAIPFELVGTVSKVLSDFAGNLADSLAGQQAAS